MTKLLKTTLFLSLLLLTSLTYAQDAIGFKIGGNLGTLSGFSDMQSTDDIGVSVAHNNGLQFGMRLEFAIDESLSIQPSYFIFKKV